MYFMYMYLTHNKKSMFDNSFLNNSIFFLKFL